MNILGFSLEHDSGVTFLKKSHVLYAANEERFNREKFTTAIPRQAFLEGRRMFPDVKFDRIAVGSVIHIIDGSVSMSRNDLLQRVATLLHYLNLERLLFTTKIGISLVKKILFLVQIPYRRKIKRIINEEWGVMAPITFIDHHVSHASGAYFTSPYGPEPVLVITLDAAGDCMCSKVFLGKSGKLQKVHEIPFFNSPAYYYMYITKLLGFKIGEEGKVMGLAATGDYSKTLPIFQSRISFDSKKISFVNHGSYRWPEFNYLKDKLNGYSKEDIAAGLQKHLEDIVAEYVRKLIDVYVGHPIPLALAGGVFSNVRLNQKIQELPNVAQVYIFPHMGDGGMSMGAAYATMSELQETPPTPLENLYLGPSYTEQALQEAVKKHQTAYTKEEFPAKKIAEALAQGKIVAIDQGRMEYGPRALGNRTILAPTADRNITERINALLRRNEFMPFAPIIRDIDAEDYFVGIDACRKALEFMTITRDVKEKCNKEAPAIVHVDGTARPQIVTKKINPLVYDVLTEYHRLTGLNILINTSFNMHGEPIVCTPEDAVKSFIKSGMDMLCVDDCILVPRV